MAKTLLTAKDMRRSMDLLREFTEEAYEQPIMEYSDLINQGPFKNWLSAIIVLMVVGNKNLLNQADEKFTSPREKARWLSEYANNKLLPKVEQAVVDYIKGDEKLLNELSPKGYFKERIQQLVKYSLVPELNSKGEGDKSVMVARAMKDIVGIIHPNVENKINTWFSLNDQRREDFKSKQNAIINNNERKAVATAETPKPNKGATAPAKDDNEMMEYFDPYEDNVWDEEPEYNRPDPRALDMNPEEYDEILDPEFDDPMFMREEDHDEEQEEVSEEQDIGPKYSLDQIQESEWYRMMKNAGVVKNPQHFMEKFGHRLNEMISEAPEEKSDEDSDRNEEKENDVCEGKETLKPSDENYAKKRKQEKKLNEKNYSFIKGTLLNG